MSDGTDMLCDREQPARTVLSRRLLLTQGDAARKGDLPWCGSDGRTDAQDRPWAGGRVLPAPRAGGVRPGHRPWLRACRADTQQKRTWQNDPKSRTSLHR